MAKNNQESVFSDPGMTEGSSPDTTQSAPKRNSKGRLIMVVGGALVVLVLVFAVISLMGGKDRAALDGGAVPGAPNVSSVPGDPRQDEIHRELIDKENAERAEQGGTVIPVLTSDQDPNANDPFPESTPVTPVVPPIEQAPTPVPTPVPPVEQAPVEVSPPVAQQPPAPTHTPEQYESMQVALQSYLQAFQASPQPVQEFTYNGQLADPNAPMSGAGLYGPQAGLYGAAQSGLSGVDASASLANSAATPRAPRRSASFVRTGTVIPAMMLGSLNSDSPGPVVAQIAMGPLAGARLVGTFQSTGKTLLINFNTLSKPGMGTFSINAVAIDENFSTGMATDVNNHTFKRFVLPTLAAFVQGYGQAYSRSGSTVVIGPGGSTITQEALNADQARRAALAEAGSVMTDSLLDNADVEPTVKLDCGGGCPVGLLFLSDL